MKYCIEFYDEEMEVILSKEFDKQIDRDSYYMAAIQGNGFFDINCEVSINLDKVIMIKCVDM